MTERVPTSTYIIACMKMTFQDRINLHGEYPQQPAPPMLDAYRKALAAQRKSKEQQDAK